MDNKQDNSGLYAFLFIVVIAIYVMVIAVIGAVLYAIGYQIYYISRYEKGEENPWYFIAVTALMFILVLPMGLNDLGYYDRTQDVGYLISGIIKVACTAVPAGLYYLYRLLEPISPAVITVIDTAHLNYSKQKITKNYRDELISFAKNSSPEIVEAFVINGFSHDAKSDENSYSDFDEANHRQSSGSESPARDVSRDDFVFDGGRFSDDRFSSESKKKRYETHYRAAHDPATPETEAILHLKQLRRDDAGKTEGIKALPKPA